PSLGIEAMINMNFVRRMLREHDQAGEGRGGSLFPWRGRDHSQRLYMLLVLSIWAKWLGRQTRAPSTPQVPSAPSPAHPAPAHNDSALSLSSAQRNVLRAKHVPSHKPPLHNHAAKVQQRTAATTPRAPSSPFFRSTT